VKLEKGDHLLRRQFLLDLGEDGLGGGDRGLDASLREKEFVLGVVNPGDCPGHSSEARKVADDEIVFVIAGNGGDEIGARDPGIIEGGCFAAIADHHVAAEFFADLGGTVCIAFEDEDFVVITQEFLGEVEADFPSAGDNDVHSYFLAAS